MKASPNGHPIRSSDYQAVRDGWISVTPLQPDLTNRDALVRLSSLQATVGRED